MCAGDSNHPSPRLWMTGKEIAGFLGKAEPTVKHQVSRLPPKVWFDLPHAADGGAAVAGLWAGHGMAGRKPGSVTSDHLDHVRRAGQLPSEGKTASSPPWAPLLNSNPPSKNSHRRSAANWRPDMRNARHCSTPPTRSSNPTTMRSRPSESGAAWRAADRPCPARWFKQRGLAR